MAGDESDTSKEQKALDRLYNGDEPEGSEKAQTGPVREPLRGGSHIVARALIDGATKFQQEFNDQWLGPDEVLDALPPGWAPSTQKQWVVNRLKSGIIKAVARTGPDPNRGLAPFVKVPSDYWKGADVVHNGEFWETGDITFTVGVVTGYGDGTEITFLDVRFDPASIHSNSPTDPSGILASPPADAVEPARDAPTRPPTREVPEVAEPAAVAPQRSTGGRPSGKHGEPIARLTIRLMTLTPEELGTHTAASLGRDLIEEFKALGLAPPSLDNAERDAAGILRAVRN